MRELTYREYRTWLTWLDEQWNNPSRSDYYMMQIAQAVARKGIRNPQDVTVGMFRLPFVMKKGEEEEKEKEPSAPPPIPPFSRVEVSQAIWLGSVGYTRKNMAADNDNKDK